MWYSYCRVFFNFDTEQINLISIKKFLGIAIVLVFSIGAFAQKKPKGIKIKKTEIILVVDNSMESINEIELMIGETEKNLSRLIKVYPNSKFYKGMIKGEYTLSKENKVTPQRGAVVTMFADKQIIPLKAEFSPRLSIGDTFGINKKKAKVIGRRKGKLKFQYQ